MATLEELRGGKLLVYPNDSAASAVLTTLASAGGESLVTDGTGPTLEVKGLTAGSGITLTANANDIEIAAAAGTTTTLASAGGTETLVQDGTGPALATKGLTAGTGISLSGGANDVTITATDLGSAVTLSSAGGSDTLVNNGVGPALAIKGINTGAGISVTGAPTTLTITNTSPASSVTLSSAGGTTLVSDGTGPTLGVKGLTAGTGITLTPSGTDITIAASSSAPSAAPRGGWDTAVDLVISATSGSYLPYDTSTNSHSDGDSGFAIDTVLKKFELTYTTAQMMAISYSFNVKGAGAYISGYVRLSRNNVIAGPQHNFVDYVLTTQTETVAGTFHASLAGASPCKFSIYIYNSSASSMTIDNAAVTITPMGSAL